MTRFLVSLTCIAAFAAAPAFAQQADEGTTDPSLVPPVPAVKTEAEANVGDLYAKVEGDWRLACEKTLSGDDPCRMGQLLRDEAGNPVIEVEVTRLKGENLPDAMMVINTPVGTILPEGVTVTIDGGKPAKLPFFYCDGQVCVTRVNLREADATAFKRGNVAEVRIVPVTAPNNPVSVNMSLTGFTAAYDSLPQLSAAN